MSSLQHLLDNNQAWANGITESDPDFFSRLSHQQSPKYFYIGCSDSRAPATQLVGLAPGELFVHRNVANLVIHTDLNCLSVMQYAVDVLKVEHIIVCGHYQCGGVLAAASGQSLGLIDNWLRHVQDVVEKHAVLLDGLEVEAQRLRVLCELNVIEQVMNVCQTTIVRQAWERGQTLAVHGWVYSLEDGLLRDLHTSTNSKDDLTTNYRAAVASLAANATMRVAPKSSTTIQRR